MLSGLKSYLAPNVMFGSLPPANAVRWPSYWPGSGDDSVGRLSGCVAFLICADLDLGFLLSYGLSGLYNPGGGF